MTEKDIDKHFKGYKLHHFLMYFPLGILFMDGITYKNPVIWICALVSLAGGLLQGQFFITGIKKMIKFLQEDVFKNPS